MVDNALLEQVLGLDETSRRELRAAIDNSLAEDDVPADVAALLDQRLATADANPDDFMTLDELRGKVRSRRTA